MLQKNGVSEGQSITDRDYSHIGSSATSALPAESDAKAGHDESAAGDS